MSKPVGTELKQEKVAPDCCQDGCNEEATMRMFWPGAGAKPVCVIRAVKAQSIASAMGFGLHVEALAHD